MLGGAPYFNESTYAGVAEWRLLLPVAMVGGLVMFVSAILFYTNMILTITRGQPEPDQQIPFAEKISGPEDVPAVLDRFWPWIAGALMLIAINYGPTLYALISTSRLNIPGMRPW